jgi:hypothetical protein
MRKTTLKKIVLVLMQSPEDRPKDWRFFRLDSSASAGETYSYGLYESISVGHLNNTLIYTKSFSLDNDFFSFDSLALMCCDDLFLALDGVFILPPRGVRALRPDCGVSDFDFFGGVHSSSASRGRLGDLSAAGESSD